MMTIYRTSLDNNPSRSCYVRHYVQMSATAFRGIVSFMKRAKRVSGRCTICAHEHKWRIELLRAGGAGLDALASKFGVSRDSIWRHWRNCVSPEAKATFLAGPVQLEQLAERAAEEGES